jgi:hypothetical protein
MATNPTGRGNGPGVDPSRARQGGRGTPVLMILIAALVLLGIGWAATEFYGNMIAPPNSDEPGVATN